MKRRDFTINALAQDENGNIIDYFNDIQNKIIGTIDDPKISFESDPLRGIRFAITKNFNINNIDYSTFMKKIPTDKILKKSKYVLNIILLKH